MDKGSKVKFTGMIDRAMLLAGYYVAPSGAWRKRGRIDLKRRQFRARDGSKSTLQLIAEAKAADEAYHGTAGIADVPAAIGQIGEDIEKEYIDSLIATRTSRPVKAECIRRNLRTIASEYLAVCNPLGGEVAPIVWSNAVMTAVCHYDERLCASEWFHTRSWSAHAHMMIAQKMLHNAIENLAFLTSVQRAALERVHATSKVKVA